MDKSILAIIPARGGSKRIPNKNIRKVDGKPLIAHTIEQADKANYIDEAIVSTDDRKIKETVLNFGGKVPFDRPKELATDTTPTSEVITHALDWYKDQNKSFDIVCLLQVTSPLRKSNDIEKTINILNKKSVQSVVSISEYMTPPSWAVKKNQEDLLEGYSQDCPLWDKTYSRSQDTKTLFHPNGAVFAGTTESWREYKSFYTPRTAPYKMPIIRSFDIDEPWELELVRNIMES